MSLEIAQLKQQMSQMMIAKSLVHHINNKHQLVLILMAISHSLIHFHGLLLTDLLDLLVATILHYIDEHEMIQVAHMIKTKVTKDCVSTTTGLGNVRESAFILVHDNRKTFRPP